ncbi:MAG: integrase arm-type DNA-binding domain-containing protein, partial [Psychromonas sp.]|nr:integrase arm-type DNA-binding domain-containing protein [Psychromonas sp.]
MARVTPLTDTEIKQAKRKEKSYLLSDGGGLQLRVNVTGSKSWLFRYLKPFTKKYQTISLGQYPSVTLAQARKKREAAKELLAQDIDPKESRDDIIKARTDDLKNTFGELAKKWLVLKKQQVKPETA